MLNRAASVAIAVAVLVGVAWVSYSIFTRPGAPTSAAQPEAKGSKKATPKYLQAQRTPVDGKRGGAAESARVAGTVLQPDGQPAAGATVTLYRRLSPWPEWRRDPIDTAVTSPSGQFAFAFERGPDLIVGAVHPGFAEVLAPADPKDPRLTLRLEPGFEVSGFVLDESGAGAPGCEVILEPTLMDTRRAVKTETNRAGYFEFENVSAGTVRAVARQARYEPAVLPLVTIGASTGLELRLEKPALKLRGRVVSAADSEKPVAGAEVRAYPNTVFGGLFIPTVDFTSEEGRFELPGLGRGNLRLEVRHKDYSTSSRPVAVSASSAELTFELGPRSAVHGRLLGAAAQRLLEGGGGIELALRNTAGDLARTAVAADGSFVFPGSFSSGPGTLAVAGGALAFQRTSGIDVPIRIEDALRTDVELETVLPPVVTGRILDPAGVPLRDARLLVSQVYQRLPAHPRLVGVTGADGVYRITGLTTGEITLSVTHDDFASQRQRVTVLAPGEISQVPDVTLQAPGGISGHVRRGRRPLAGALVLATGRTFATTTVSDRRGRYELRGLPPDTYRVRARFSTLRLAVGSKPVEVRPGEVVTRIDLRFQPGRRVTGRVVGADDQPLEGITVTVRGMAGAGSIALTDLSGNFSLEVPRAKVELFAYAGGLGFHSVTVVDQGTETVTLRLDTPPTASLTARVHGLPGRQRIPGGVLRVEPLDFEGDPDERAKRTIRTRWVEMSGGELRVLLCPAGRVRLTLQSEGYAPFVRDLDLTPAVEHDLEEILMEPGNTVAGIITDDAGRPVPGASVFLGQEIDREMFEAQLHADPEGRFRISGVTVDSLSLVVLAPRYAPRTVRLRLPQDVLRRDPLPIVLERGSTISVRVVDSMDRPQEGGYVLLWADGALVQAAELDESGVGSFWNRGPGKYEVLLFGNEGIRTGVEVTESKKTYPVTLRIPER